MRGNVAQVAAWALGYRNLPAPTPATVASPAPVTFPTTPLVGAVYIALGADLTKPWYTWSWTDITQWVRFAAGISTGQGRPDESSVGRTSSASLTLDNRDGRFSRRNPLGPYYGQLTYNTPIWGTIDPGSGVVTRLQQYVTEWPTRWDRSGNDSTVPIACAGVLRRLAQGADPRSAQRRTIVAAAPTAYWPMEEATGATQVASGLSGGTTLTTSGNVAFGTQIKPPGSAGAVSLGVGASISGSTGIPAGPVAAWEMELCLAFSPFPTGNLVGNRYTVATVRTDGGPIPIWGVELVNDSFVTTTYNLGLYYDAGAGIFGNYGINPPPPMVVGQTYHWRMSLAQSGGNIIWSLYQDGQLVTSTGSVPGTLYAPTQVSFNISAGTADPASNPASVSHAAFWVPTRAQPATYLAATGFAGEQAHVRIARNCAEEGVALQCVSGVSAPMGPQPTGTLTAVLRDAEATDQGVIYEAAWGLGYQALSERQNAPVLLPLDFHAGHIALEPEPADDDQRLRNRWRLSRQNGGSYVAEATSGPLGTEPGGPGVFDDSATINVATDAQLASQAGWRRHTGTTDEDRWPSIALRLHGTPDLIPAWTSLPYGARTQAANPPAQVAPDVIDAVIEGWTERWDTVSWDVVLATSPYRPYEVYTVGAAGNRGRVDNVSSTLAADATAGATTISVASPGALWRTGAVNFDIEVGGERMTVTNIAGSSSPQTFTVVRSVNTIVKAQTANPVARVRLWRPGVYALRGSRG